MLVAAGSPQTTQMIWGVNWAIWLTAVATAVIALGVVFAIVQVGESRKARHGELAVKYARWWGEPLLAEGRQLARGLNPEELRDWYLYLKALNCQLGVSRYSMDRRSP
jgi:hypothetical protein